MQGYPSLRRTLALAVMLLALVPRYGAAQTFLVNLDRQTAAGGGTWAQLSCVPSAANGPQSLGVRIALGTVTQAGTSALAGFAINGQISGGGLFSGSTKIKFSPNGTFILDGGPLILNFDGGRKTIIASVGGHITADGKLSLSGSGADVGAPTIGCSSITFTLVGNFALDPESSSAAEVLNAVKLNLFVRQFGHAISRRFNAIYRRMRHRGVSPRQTNLTPDRDGLHWQADGLAAGDGFELPFGVWASASYISSEDDFISTAFEAERINVLTGADISLNNNLVIGLAIGYEHSKTDTVFNAGSVDGNAWTIAPYGALVFGENLAIDLTLGYSDARADQIRTDPIFSTPVSSKVEGRRWFYSTNLTYTHESDGWLLTGRAGLLFASSGDEAFTESDGTLVNRQHAKLGQLRFGTEVAYTGRTLEPFGSFTYEVDYSRTRTQFSADTPQPDDETTGGVVGLGVRYFGSQALSGSLEYSAVLGRGTFTEQSVTVLLRSDF